MPRHKEHHGGGHEGHQGSGGGRNLNGNYQGDARDHRHENGHDERFPFLWGCQEQFVPIAAIAYTAGLKIPTVKIPKNGYLIKLRFHYVGSVNLSAAGSGTPNLLAIIQQYILSYNGGFMYRNMDGESIYVKALMDNAGPDIFQQGPNWVNYAPATTGSAQPVSFLIEDNIALNPWANADKYVLAAHARNTDVVLDMTFGNTSAVGNGTFSAFTGTLYVSGMFFLDPPNYVNFQEPDLDKVQQVTTDTSYTNVVIGDNTVPIVPINGPKYLRVAFKAVFNGTADTQGATSNVTTVQLKFNNGLDRYYIASQDVIHDNMIALQRVTCTAAAVASPLPPGWYMLDWVNDTGRVNQISVAGRNVISTEDIGALWLIVTVAAGTTLTANNQIKLIKQVELPAVANTSKLVPPRLNMGGGY